MFLKSLAVRGFKSFADPTTLRFEPGITVIVGPNGSGKSNVVDALAWVLGTRSPKLLRGGELADVIFAGSPSRPRKGHALVEITLDNSDGRLGRGALGPAGAAEGLAEVRLSREISASGDSRYAINGVDCRLLDVQELLSDSGLGRELHTIVGQGQLEGVLEARPEERRAFIEEAAGILKHRRRRERAERKLEQVDVHVERLRTVLKELRRQLRPLQRQAEAASEHEQVVSDLRDVRARLAAHDLAVLRARWAAQDATEAELERRRSQVAARLQEATAEAGRLERAVAAGEQAIEAARATAERLARLAERLGGTAELVEERRRHLFDYVEEPLVGRRPEELRRQAAELDAERGSREQARVDAVRLLEEAAAASRDAQVARRELERRTAAAARERAAAREHAARWQGEVAARRQGLKSAWAEAERLAARREILDTRLEEIRGQIEAVLAEIRGLDADEWRLTEALEAAETAAAAATAELDAALARHRRLERDRDTAIARADALRAAASDPGGAVLELEGILGTLADNVHVRAGSEAAVAAALGPLAEAVLARSSRDGEHAVSHLKASGAGRAHVLPVSPEAGDGDVDVRPPEGTRPAAELLTVADAGLRATLHRLLATTFVARKWEEAVDLHRRHPRLRFVTAEGDVAGPEGFVGGSSPGRSAVLNAAKAADAARRAARLGRDLDAAEQAVGAAQRELTAREQALAAAIAAINDSDARITGAAERLARLNNEAETVAHQRDLLDRQGGELAEARRVLEADLAQLERARPEAAADAPDVDEQEGVLLDEAMEEARRGELDARLRVERLDEQVRHLATAADDLRREAAEVEAALAAAARRRDLRRDHLPRCAGLAAVVAAALAAADDAVATAGQEHARAVTARDAESAALRGVRAELARLRTDEAALVDEQHDAELARAELRHELDAVHHSLSDLGLAPDEALHAYPDAVGDERGDLEAAAAALERRLALIGQVNPLALEEFEALEERRRYLSGQLDDLLRARRDLREVVAAVDERIREVFNEAFTAVAEEFEAVFATMFPGGEGRLVLTADGDGRPDPLTAGIEVAARPAGKRIRRLSLLSGGERSLTALCLLLAIFRARPSPFYVLDEVEAALDDVNLQRLLRVFESFRPRSQLIVVTHQKRTMEIADVLYGVTMGSDAVSKVVSQRVTEPVAVP